MIVGTLLGWDRHAVPAAGSLGAGLAEALEWLRAWDPATPDGRHPIRGEAVFALVQTYDTGPATERRFESHQRYWDVQFVAGGVERILYAPTTELQPLKPYNAATDLIFYADPPASSSVLVRAGEVAVFGPADAHKPGCMAGARHTVRKVVVKIAAAD